MAAEIENLTLEMLRAIRRDQDVARREMRELSRAFVGLSENVTRQGTRLELAIGDLRMEIDTIVKIEVRGSLAGMETRVEDRVLTEIEDLQRQLDELRRSRDGQTSPTQPGA